MNYTNEKRGFYSRGVNFLKQFMGVNQVTTKRLGATLPS